MTKILLVDDDKKFANVVEDWLAGEGYDVEAVYSGSQGLERAVSNSHDVLILDWGLPNISGVEICREYRGRGGSSPIIMLTGKTSVSDKEEGLDSGADDYLTKPFHPRELSARLRALMRRQRTLSQAAPDPIIKAGELVLDSDGFRLTKSGTEINLLPKEFALLEFLMRNPNKVFSSQDLLDEIWSKESENSPDTVRVHITKLRAKIDTEGKPSLIRTIHRVGYKLELPEPASDSNKMELSIH
jgi:DNA-binding response OmpR family regulator